MNHSAPPPGRTRRIVLLGLAVLGMVGAAFVVRGPLLMAAPMCMAGRWHGCFGTFNGVVFVMLAALASRRWWRTTAEAPTDRPRPAFAPVGPVGPLAVLCGPDATGQRKVCGSLHAVGDRALRDSLASAMTVGPVTTRRGTRTSRVTLCAGHG